MGKQRSPKKWQRLEETLLCKTRVFDLYKQRMKSSNRDFESDFFYLKSRDFVNVIPITPEDEVVMLRQYRHGADNISLEFPGGIIDSPGEKARDAALRELREETGYEAQEIELLSEIHPNPAIQNNICYGFVARGLEKVSGQDLDPAEEIEVELIPLSELPDLIRAGEVTHSLMLSVFLHFLLSRGRVDLSD